MTAIFHEGSQVKITVLQSLQDQDALSNDCALYLFLPMRTGFSYCSDVTR